jgi:hypothetical protein
MRLAPWLGTALVALCPGFASAVDTSDFAAKTTADLYRVCSVAPSDPLHLAAIEFCEGFFVGAVSYHDAVTDRENLKRLVCYPPNVTRDDGVLAFLEWAAKNKDNQKFMSDPAVFGAVRGLAAKWPCK